MNSNYRYTLVKSYYGFGGDLCVLVGAIEYSRTCLRKIIVDWDGGLYGESKSTGGIFNYYFKSPSLLNINHLPNKITSIYPVYWKDYLYKPPHTRGKNINLTLSRPEDIPKECDSTCVVITRDSAAIRRHKELYSKIAKNFTPNDIVVKKVSDIISKPKTFKKIIGVHFRHGNGENGVIPPKIDWFKIQINNYIKSLNLSANDVCIFVATDCFAVFNAFRRLYPNVIHSGKSYEEIGSGPLHYDRKISNEIQLANGTDVLVDMYTLEKSDLFIGSGGFFSYFVQMLRSFKNCVIYQGSRSFKLTEVEEPLKLVSGDKILSSFLLNNDIRLDGIYFFSQLSCLKIYYYNMLLYSGSKSALFCNESLLQIKNSLIKVRLY